MCCADQPSVLNGFCIAQRVIKTVEDAVRKEKETNAILQKENTRLREVHTLPLLTSF